MACECPDPLPDRWWQDPELHRLVAANHGDSPSAMAAAHGIRPNTLSTWRARCGLPKLQPGGKTKAVQQARDDEVALTVETLEHVNDALRARGLDPDEWVVVRVTVKTWEGYGKNAAEELETVPLHGLTVTVRPRLTVDLLRPAAVAVPRIQKARRPDKSRPRLVVFVGDEQAPYHDDTLHRLFLDWLAANRPHEAVHLGDLLDLPTLSRHRTNPAWNASPQECVDAGYRILRGYREASPDTVWTALPGNHDERLRDYQLARAAELYGVKPADCEDAALSLPALLHLDALGIGWAGGEADYEHAQVDVSDRLVARHGFVTGANSAEKTVRRLGINVVVGHTHRQVVTYVTEDRMRETLTLMAVEAGAMCKRDGGLGYTVAPNWQQGAYAANVWPDGSFSGEHIKYRDGVLTWRDQRYTGRADTRLRAA